MDSTDTPPVSGRSTRFQGRNALRKITTVERCSDCGWTPIGSGVGIRRTPEGVAGFAGIASCGRVWLCPVCNAKVMARRAIEVGAALTWAHVEGYSIIWGSLTVRHNAFSDLARLLDIQREAWRRVVSDRQWRDDSATRTVDHEHEPSCPADCERKRDTILTGQGARIGYIRAAELTIGRNGWHPHFHPLIIVRTEDAHRVAAYTVRLWLDGVAAAGGEAEGYGAQQLRVLSGVDMYDALAGYVTKSTYDGGKLHLEAVWSQGKSGRGRAHETVSHWMLLAAIERGEADECERWWQLEEAVQGHRMITWSRGLRTFAGLGVEVDDETIAAEEVGTRDDTVCFLSPAGWGAVRSQPFLMGSILDTLESGGWAQLRPLLDAHGVEWFTLEEAHLYAGASA